MGKLIRTGKPVMIIVMSDLYRNANMKRTQQSKAN